MKRFEAKLNKLCIELSNLAGAAGAFSYLYQDLSQEQKRERLKLHSDQTPPLVDLVKDITDECLVVGLPLSALCAKRLFENLNTNVLDTNSFNSQCKELTSRIEDELSSSILFSISPEKQQLVTGLDLFGDKVGKAFPSAVFDIEEAGKCIAFDRWTAAVFHLSRVSEITLIQICKRVGYNALKPSFGDAVNYLEKELFTARKGPLKANSLIINDIEFFSGVYAHMAAVKEAWRNRVSHLDRKYTEEEVQCIWITTKTLMQYIAENISEPETEN